MKTHYFLRTMLASALVSLAVPGTAAEESPGASGTLPAIHITTDTSVDDLTREEYVPASYWLEANGTEGVEDIASEAAPLPLQIRGRGNWTWVGYDKKPYRLLLDSPAPVAGLKASDYFGLHAHADDNLAFMRNTLGFELARRLGIDWTPSHSPVELYFNGEYRGLYFCTELVRTDPDRVNITPQADNDDTDVTGGWLVEIDNYDTDPHITLTEGNGQEIIFSHKTPLSLSAAQEEFLRSQMQAIDDAIYADDKSVAAWADYVDIDRLARFYIVHELMDNTEAFHGSCFLHRDRGADAKWMFGPVWDFGSSFFRGSGKFIWQDANYTLTWIKEIYKFPEFQNKVKEIWASFCEEGYPGIDGFIRAQGARIKDGAAADFARWPKYGNEDIDAKVSKVIYMLGNKARWLGTQWGTIPAGTSENVEIFLRGNISGWGTSLMFMPQADGTYTIDVPSLADLFKIASADFSTVDLGGDGVTELKAGEVYRLVSGSGSKNISVWGEIKDAHLVFNPAEQTLLVTGTQIEPEEPTETPFYFRGDMNSWKTNMQFQKQPDGTYALDIDGLTGKFKIADEKFKLINLGGDNVTPVEVGVPYKLISSGKNITLKEPVEKARLEVNLDTKTLLLSDRSTVGIEEVKAEQAPARILTVYGVELPAGTVPAPGIYIFIGPDGKASKRLVK